MFRYVVGNTRPDIVVSLVQDADAVDVSEVTSVVFRLAKPSGAVVERPLTLVDSASATYSGQWSPGDLDEAGEMFGEIVVSFSDGRIQNGEEPVVVVVRNSYQEL